MSKEAPPNYVDSENKKHVLIKDWYFTCVLYLIEAGREPAVIADLHSKKHSLLCKTLGQFDLASLHAVNSLENPIIYEANSYIQHTRILSGFPLSGDYVSPTLTEFCDNYPLFGLVCLEIDKWLYSDESGVPSSIDACCSIIHNIRNNISLLCGPENIAFYGGFGKSELLALIRANSFNEVWDFVQKARNIRLPNCCQHYSSDDEFLPVFTNTKTIPLINHNNIDFEENRVTVKNINGEASATINIQCPSGFDSFISQYFPHDKGYTVINTLGNIDLTVSTVKPKKISSLTEDILIFRRGWAKEHPSPIITTTLLHEEYNPRLCTHAKGYPVLNSPFEIKPSKELEKNNPALSNRILSYLHRIQSLIQDRSTQFPIHSMAPNGEYLTQVLSEYDLAVQQRDLEEQYQIEGSLLEIIESAELCFVQRLSNVFDITRSSSFLPLPFSDGIFSNLLSLETIIDFIIFTWNKLHSEYPGSRKRIGFTVFSDNFGFKLRYGEVIFLPFAATISPFSAEGNWLTLTHELSHAIYNRLNVTTENIELFENVRLNNFADSILEKRLSPDINFEDEVFELFAHWYDYYHFYAGNINQYLVSIWSSWLCLPIVHVNFIEYFFRSFVVFVYRDLLKLIETMRKGEDYFKKYTEESWTDHLDLLSSLNIANLGHYIHLIERKDEKDFIIDLFDRFNVLLVHLFYKYKDDTFRDKINKDYENLKKHTCNIANGELLFRDIVNPYLLVKKVWDDKFQKATSGVNNAIIMSLKNEKKFLYKDAPNES